MNETLPDTHYCPRCGTQLTDQIDTCPSCGQALCPACGVQVDENATRCPSCGVVFELACPDCGAPLKAEDVRCGKCGATFKGELSPPAAPAAAPAVTQAEQLQQAYLFALNQLQAKVPPEQVEEQLVATGLTVSASHALVGTLQSTRRQVERATGKRAMIIGGLWTVGGLAITLIGQSLANERSGSYLILWGAVIIGALQFLRGLAQFLRNAPARPLEGVQLEVDPLMAANGYVWPIPKQSQSTWLGVIAFLGLMALLSFANLGSPLIDKPASQVNLAVTDVGSGFALADERGVEAFNNEDLRDANQRTWEGDNSAMQATVLVGKQRSSDSTSALLAAFDKSFWQNVSVDVSFDLPHSVIVGKQGALEPFHFQVEGRTVDGYLLTFIRENVVVFVLEMGPSGAVTEQQILSHAQLIDERLK